MMSGISATLFYMVLKKPLIFLQFLFSKRHKIFFEMAVYVFDAPYYIEIHDMEEWEIVEFLMGLSEEEYSGLEKNFRTIRQSLKAMLEEITGDDFFDDKFKGGDIEDILFYQISNDLPIG